MAGGGNRQPLCDALHNAEQDGFQKFNNNVPAAIDGGNAWHCFRYITLPLLMPTLTVTTVLNVIYGLKVFDTVYSLTNGGPGYATEVLYTGVYKEFGLGRYAVGTTLSTIMFLVMLVIGYFMIRSMAANEDVEL